MDTYEPLELVFCFDLSQDGYAIIFCCLFLHGDHSEVTHGPNPSFVAKNLRGSFRKRGFQLDAVCSPLYGENREVKLHLLCPVDTLGCYVERKAPHQMHTATGKSGWSCRSTHSVSVFVRPIDGQDLTLPLCSQLCSVGCVLRSYACHHHICSLFYLLNMSDSFSNSIYIFKTTSLCRCLLIGQLHLYKFQRASTQS